MGFKFLTKATVLRSLQGWICIVGLMAVGNAVGCFVDHSFLRGRLYTVAPDRVTDLAARLFGLWTLLSGLLRIACAFFITVRPLYHLTFASFVVACGHFGAEVAVYKTAAMTVGVLTPLGISGLSIVGMLVGYFYMNQPVNEADNDNETMPRRVEDIRFTKFRGRHAKGD